LIATESHLTASYQINNGNVFGLLKPSVINGEGWAYILKFNSGRKSWEALEVQAEGPAAITTCKA
jgi:hypothetical protein